MEMSKEQMHWMMKMFQPEKTVASFPGAASLNTATRAALLGLDPDYYSKELERLAAGAKAATLELLADPNVAEMVDRLAKHGKCHKQAS